MKDKLKTEEAQMVYELLIEIIKEQREEIALLKTKLFLQKKGITITKVYESRIN